MEGMWFFGESLTMEVTPRDDVLISVSCNKQYDLVVAAVALATTTVGQICIPMASVIPLLKMEDRDMDGLVYATQEVAFDLLKDGAKIGKFVAAFETKKPPPPSGDGCQMVRGRKSAGGVCACES